MADFHSDQHELLDLEESETSMEELQDQVQKAQSELIELRRRQDQIEKEKQRLEELSRKQELLEQGRIEMIDKITRSLTLIQKEMQDAQRRLEQLSTIDAAFVHHLEELEEIDCKSWNSKELSRELTKAIGIVEEVEATYSRLYPKISLFEEPQEDSFHEERREPTSHGFLYWLEAGFAFTLPLFLLGVLLLILFLRKG